MTQDNFGDNPSAPPSGKRYVLAIGINDYGPGSGLPSLKYPERDAGKLVEILCDEYGFENVPIQEKTRKGIKNAIAEVKKAVEATCSAGEDSAVAIFFAGHGKPDYWMMEDDDEFSVSEILNLLIALKTQVLLIADCCFAGSMSAKASHEALFAKIKNPEISFYVLTSSNAEPTKDQSAFFECLMQILKEEEIEDFQSLSGMLGEKINSMTFFSSENTAHELFLLRRYDPNKPRLRKALYDIIEVTDESLKLRRLGPRTVTLLYLHGSPHCAHHLFVRYLFNYLHTQTQVFSLIPTILKLGQMEAQKNKRIGDLFSSKQGQGDFMGLENHDGAEGRVFFLKIEDNYKEKDYELLQKDLLDFWESINNPALLERLNTRFYFIILDERGAGGKIDNTPFENPHPNARSSFVWIQSLKPDLLADWQLQKTIGEGEITLPKFKLEAFETFMAQFAETDFFIANTIRKIAGHCGYPKLADEILLNQTS